MQPDFHSYVATFALPLEALSAVRALHGDVAMLEHALAHPADDEATRLVALMLTDARLALNLMRDLVIAQRTGKPWKVASCSERLSPV